MFLAIVQVANVLVCKLDILQVCYIHLKDETRRTTAHNMFDLAHGSMLLRELQAWVVTCETSMDIC